MQKNTLSHTGPIVATILISRSAGGSGSFATAIYYAVQTQGQEGQRAMPYNTGQWGSAGPHSVARTGCRSASDAGHCSPESRGREQGGTRQGTGKVDAVSGGY